jgi:hypothetical protein
MERVQGCKIGSSVSVRHDNKGKKPTGITIQDLPMRDCVRVLKGRSRHDIAVRIHSLPQSKSSINHHVMKPKDRVVGGIIQVGHVSATPSSSMDDIVDRLETVRVLESCSKGVGLGTELAVVAVECEEVVKSISERYATVVQDRTNRFVQADSIDAATVGSAKRRVPRCPLYVMVSLVLFCNKGDETKIPDRSRSPP